MRRPSAWALLAAFAIIVTGNRVNAETAKEIVQKAIDAHGGADNLKKYPGGKETEKGTLFIMGLEVAIEAETIYLLPDQFKSVVKAEVMGQKATIVQIFNAGKSKMTTNGEETKLSDPQKIELKESLYLESVQKLVSLLDGKKFAVSLLDKADKVGGKEVVGVLAKSKGFKDAKLFFDAKSNLLVKIERQGLDIADKDVPQEILLREYKKIDGIMRASKTTVFLDGKKYIESELVEYKHLDKVDKKEFDISD